MFNKLIVSTSERRKARTARFFCGTSIVYSTVFAGVLALSVLASNPNLADTGERTLALIAPPAPVVPTVPRPTADRPLPRPSAAVDPRTYVDLGHVRPATPPSIGATPDNSNAVPGATGPAGPGGPGVPGAEPSDKPVPPAPQQPDPPRPKPAAAQVEPPKVVHLPSKILQGKALERHTPPYPPLAKTTRTAGPVSVEVIIAPDGHVETARAVSGHPLLAQAAEQSARQWRFEPTVLNGIAVRVTGVIVFNFTLE